MPASGQASTRLVHRESRHLRQPPAHQREATRARTAARRAAPHSLLRRAAHPSRPRCAKRSTNARCDFERRGRGRARPRVGEHAALVAALDRKHLHRRPGTVKRRRKSFTASRSSSPTALMRRYGCGATPSRSTDSASWRSGSGLRSARNASCSSARSSSPRSEDRDPPPALPAPARASRCSPARATSAYGT